MLKAFWLLVPTQFHGLRDPHDRDSMIFADGAGAVVLEARESDVPVGMLKHAARTDTQDYLDLT
jgi:3-oxoacyl-[acyl-carrier-protein] synthase III